MKATLDFLRRIESIFRSVGTIGNTYCIDIIILSLIIFFSLYFGSIKFWSALINYDLLGQFNRLIIFLQLRELLIISSKSYSYCTTRLCSSTCSYRPFYCPKDSSRWCLMLRNRLNDRASLPSMSLWILAAASRFQGCCLLFKRYSIFCWKYSSLRLSHFWTAALLSFSYLSLATSVSCLRCCFQDRKATSLLEKFSIPLFEDLMYILLWCPASILPFSSKSPLEIPYCSWLLLPCP